jgi:hypothetical protein
MNPKLSMEVATQLADRLLRAEVNIEYTYIAASLKSARLLMILRQAMSIKPIARCAICNSI